MTKSEEAYQTKESGGVEKLAHSEGKRVKKSGGVKNVASLKKLKPLKVAAERIADILCSLSADEELFVIPQGEKPERKVDTKTLKEFSSVIKEISGVICELNGISTAGETERSGGVRIEFDEEAGACSE